MQSLRLVRMLLLFYFLLDLWELQSKTKLIGENAVTGTHSSCTLRVMGSCNSFLLFVYYEAAKQVSRPIRKRKLKQFLFNHFKP